MKIEPLMNGPIINSMLISNKANFFDTLPDANGRFFFWDVVGLY